jgi:exocyst complex component 5
MIFARVNTEPCAACCEMLEKVRDSANQNLSGKNLEVFLTEIGLAFHVYAECSYFLPYLQVAHLVQRLLLDHLKKFPVSAAGGLMLAK